MRRQCQALPYDSDIREQSPRPSVRPFVRPSVPAGWILGLFFRFNVSAASQRTEPLTGTKKNIADLLFLQKFRKHIILFQYLGLGNATGPANVRVAPQN